MTNCVSTNATIKHKNQYFKNISTFDGVIAK